MCTYIQGMCSKGCSLIYLLSCQQVMIASTWIRKARTQTCHNIITHNGYSPQAGLMFLYQCESMTSFVCLTLCQMKWLVDSPGNVSGDFSKPTKIGLIWFLDLSSFVLHCSFRGHFNIMIIDVFLAKPILTVTSELSESLLFSLFTLLQASVMDTGISILMYITYVYLYCLQLLLVTLNSAFMGLDCFRIIE